MSVITNVCQRWRATAGPSGDRAGSRSRLLTAGLAAAGLAGAATAVVRRRSHRLVLPDAGMLASQTAVSVHNAAKGEVLSAVRQADAPTATVVEDAVARALADASGTGADVTAVVLGAVEGAHEAAGLLGVDARDLAERAGRAAVAVVGRQGAVAEQRVREALGVLDLDEPLGA